VRTSLLPGIAAGFILVIATACGGSAATTPPQATAAAAPSVAGGAAPTCATGLGTGQQVAIANFAFTPNPTTASAGGTVTWTNGDSATHTVTFDNGPDCGNLATGASVTATFPAPGTYAYHCKIHSSMHGSVTVS
jgi:plastocyanin